MESFGYGEQGVEGFEGDFLAEGRPGWLNRCA